MQVTLKQSEIEVALKNYIQAMGINLAGKSIDVAFTAGRKEAGISAELDINETDQPQVAYGTLTRAPVVAGIATSQELRLAQESRPSLVSRETADLNMPITTAHIEPPEATAEVVEPEVTEVAIPAAPKVSLFG